MTLTTSPALVQTRESWHRVAEHVLAAGQFAAARTIRLRPLPGGFATAAGAGGRLRARGRGGGGRAATRCRPVGRRRRTRLPLPAAPLPPCRRRLRRGRPRAA